ncbi:adenylyl-sulfate kinase [Streptomyces avicenniae]|uniref:adenylyl-sulfate kinase n=1 Tax=Streptomyces avicenniae TaxID=500153 RepID=UPI00069CB9B5|nr:adenylyl-sulfate kinase [Streptomyces avicenniae]
MSIPGGGEPAALFLNGTVGAGKTSVAEAAGELLADAGVPHAVLDLDQLRRVWPAPADDPFNAALLLRNVRDVTRNARAAGAVRLVLAGVVEGADDRRAFADALGVPMTVCRLTADLDVVRARLRARHSGRDAELRWHLDRCAELDEIIAASGTTDLAVPSTAGTVPDVARAVLTGVGWL